MGGTMKGAHGHMHGSNRRKWSNAYVVMVIVCCVFGCGILGLMGIHRLRERRSLNLVIKEKDEQILSLHLLLQKEREHAVETKRKTEEMKMKMKMTSLGSQKAELSSKMSEMQSTISSLREEQRAVESAFQEKQSEANMMREKYAQVSEQSPQVEALKEELRRKEGEIEDLKFRLQLRGAEIGSNAATAEANATESEGRKSASAETEAKATEIEAKLHESEAVVDTSSENGGTAKADRTSDDGQMEPMRKKGDEHEHEHGKSVDDQEPEVEESPRRFRGRRGYLRRVKGKRWRSIGKQTQVRSIGASTMADDALRNSSTESTHALLEKPAKSSETKMNEQEQTGEEISIKKPTEERHENWHTNFPGRKRAAERNGGEEQDGVQSRDGEESEDKEETDETEF